MIFDIHSLSHYLNLYIMPIALANDHQVLFLNESFRATFSNLVGNDASSSLSVLDLDHLNQLSLNKHTFRFYNEFYSIYVDKWQYHQVRKADRFVMYKYMMDHHIRHYKGCALKPQIIRNEEKPPVFFLNHGEDTQICCMIKICPGENISGITLLSLDFLIKSIEKNEALNRLELIANVIDKWAIENDVRLETILVHLDFEGNRFQVQKNSGYIYLVNKEGLYIQIEECESITLNLEDIDFALLSTEAMPKTIFNNYDGINPIPVFNETYKYFEANQSKYSSEIGNLLIKPNLGESLFSYHINCLTEMQNVIEYILKETRIEESEDFAVRLILSELVTNAFKHACNDRTEPFVNVLIHLTPNSISIEVYNIDHSKNHEVLEKACLPDDILSEGGRGLFLVKEFAYALFETNDSVIAIVKRGKTNEEKLEI